jgi:hypothetical protein
MSGARRTLTFACLADIIPDVERLLDGHTTAGNWSLGQICNHLAQSIHRTIDGFPGPAPWLLRKTVGRVVLWRILRTGCFVEGMRAPPASQPPAGADARAEADRLRAALERLAAHPGPLVEHPLGGWVTREAWERFHCMHCAHHLSFVAPTGSKSSAP